MYYAVFSDNSLVGVYQHCWQAVRLQQRLVVLTWSVQMITVDRRETYDSIYKKLRPDGSPLGIGGPSAVYHLLEQIEGGRFGLTYSHEGIFADQR